MTTKNDGGAVFPFQPLDRQGMQIAEMQLGISRRDWLAGMAMQGFLGSARISPDAELRRILSQQVAIASYELADAMIEEGEK